MECAIEPCCRSINHKKTSALQNEANCELLHDVIFNATKELLQKNPSYDYSYLVNPPKVEVEKTYGCEKGLHAAKSTMWAKKLKASLFSYIIFKTVVYLILAKVTIVYTGYITII